MEWKCVPGYEGLYEISEDGQVRNVKTGLVLKWRVTGWRGREYAQVVLSGQGKPRAYSIHRLVCHAFNGPPPTPKHEAAHEDGSRLNNHWRNLSWKTREENQADRLRHGTDLRGEKSPNAKLTPRQVIAIRRAREAGAGRPSIAREHGVSVALVKMIETRKAWAVDGVTAATACVAHLPWMY